MLLAQKKKRKKKKNKKKKKKKKLNSKEAGIAKALINSKVNHDEFMI